MAEPLRRDENLDLIRVVAIAMVVLLHANAGQFLRQGDDWWISNVINSGLRICVPLFIIISGALLVHRQEPIKRHLQRAGKMALLIGLWSYIYVAWIMMSGDGFGFLWDKRLTSLLDPTLPVWIARTPMMSHLPFLYGMVGFYLFLPVLQAVCASSNGRSILMYFATVCLAASSLSTLNAATGVSAVYLPGIEAFFLFAGYAAFGAILRDYKPGALSEKILWLMFALATAVTALLTMLASETNPNEMFGTYWSPTVAIAACFAFLAIRGIPVPEWASKLVSRLAALSFGVYFVHMIVMGPIIAAVWSNSSDQRLTNVLLAAAITYSLSIAITWALSLNRITRRLIS